MTAPIRPGDSTRLRMGVVAMVVVSLFAALFARLWFLQVIAVQESTRAVIVNQVRFVPEEAPRGRILDRNGRIIVDNRVSMAVTVNRVKFENTVESVTRLAALLKLPPAVLVNRINDQRFSPYKPVPVAEDVSEDIVVYLGEHRHEFPGVEATQLTERAYPNGTLAAHLLGYVGEINEDELKVRKGDYRQGDSIGKSGVERSFEEHLRGEPGLVKLEVDAHGRVLQTLSERPPEQGTDLQLTVDLEIQRLTEESLVQGIEAARKGVDRENKKPFVAPAGAAVVIDPRDGSVVAMASFPTYSPADFVNGIRPEVFQALNRPESHYPLTNRVVSGQYAPGSTFKLMTAVAGLKRGLITPPTTVDDRGSLRVGDQTFSNAGKRPWGRVALTRALAVSSDVYFYTLGERFCPNNRGGCTTHIQEAAREMGLGEKSGIALESERSGRVPDAESRKRLHEKYPKAYIEGKWFPGDNVNLSIGQGDMVATPLQLANAYAAFANAGTLYTPRVAARALHQDGTVVEEFEPQVKRRLGLDMGQRQAILAGLRGAVTDPDGTARGAFVGFPSGFPVAGKTGTAQVTGKQDTALFVGFAPADNPQFVVAVVMEEAGFGGSVAAPVARRIMQGLAGKPPGAIELAGGVD